MPSFLGSGSLRLGAFLVGVGLQLTGTLAPSLPPRVAGASGAAALPGIRHVVEVMLENHTFDDLFGHFPGARGIPATVALPSPTTPGGSVRPLLAPGNEGEVEGGLNNSRAAELAMMQRRSGRYEMDGYTRYPGEGLASITGFAPAADPDLQYLAERYELFDANFQPVIGPTLPNALAAVAGTNEGWTSNDQPPASLRFPSIFEELAAAGLRSGFYSGVPTSVYAGSVWPRLLPSGEAIAPLSSFFAALRRGALPAFSFVRPGVGYSEEPPEDVGEGDAWIGQLLAGVGRSRQWPSTAVVITYDEGGGFWDGTSPPPASGYGTRTPMVIVSPFARRGVFGGETTNLSVLSLLDRLFGLRPLTPLQARQNDLLRAFDAFSPPLPPPVPPVVPKATIGFYAPDSGELADPPALRPGRPAAIELVEQNPGLTALEGSATLHLELVAPRGVVVAPRLRSSLRLEHGKAELSVSLARAGYYRLSASAPGGVLGYLTLDVGVSPNTP